MQAIGVGFLLILAGIAAESAARFVQELKEYTASDLLVMDEPGYLPLDEHGAHPHSQISGRPSE